MELRDYQRKALDDLYAWFGQHEGNPCIEAPTGSGKSMIIAQFCKENLERNPDMRILLATHMKELIEQDFNAIKRAWPEAPCGIFSAGLKKKEIMYPMTVCGIQSVYKKYADFGYVDVLIVDEAHLIPEKGTGMYLSFIEGLRQTNPGLTIIGLTATPYRLKHGMITDEPAIFNEPIIKTVSITELQRRGFLSLVRSKRTAEKLDPTGVKISGGDFVESELQKKFDNDGTSLSVVRETIARAEGRKHILFFCCGIEHAEHVRDILREQGETAESVSSKCTIKERDDIINRFKAGEVRFLTNTAILTTGFDYPDIDCLVMMRPTLSPGLYVQIVGRAMRPKSDGGDALVLDFAGNIWRHGPITDVKPPEKGSKRKGIAPSKMCPVCDEIVPLQARVCPCCGHEWPRRKADEDFHLHDDDINGKINPQMMVGFWRWSVTKSRAGEDMVRVTYRRSFIDPMEINEYFLLWRDDGVGISAQKRFTSIMERAGLEVMDYDTIDEVVAALNKAKGPVSVEYVKNGRYLNAVRRYWEAGNV